MKTVFAYEVVLYDTDQDNRGHFFITSGLSFAKLPRSQSLLMEKCSRVSRILNLSMMITLPRDIIRDYIDGEKFINEIPCDNEGRELATLNQNASRANDNW